MNEYISATVELFNPINNNWSHKGNSIFGYKPPKLISSYKQNSVSQSYGFGHFRLHYIERQ